MKFFIIQILPYLMVFLLASAGLFAVLIRYAPNLTNISPPRTARNTTDVNNSMIIGTYIRISNPYTLDDCMCKKAFKHVLITQR